MSQLYGRTPNHPRKNWQVTKFANVEACCFIGFSPKYGASRGLLIGILSSELALQPGRICVTENDVRLVMHVMHLEVSDLAALK